MQWYGRLERHPKTQTPFYGILHFEHHHPRYPRTLLLACRVQWYECLGRHPRIQATFMALCIANITIQGIQKHFCWTVGHSGIGVWGATPEPRHHFMALCISNNTILGIQKHHCWPMGYGGMSVWGATPEPEEYFWHCAVQTPPS